MNLGKYIQELLFENETVVIPGFGAFISIVKSSEIDEDTDEFKPPSKTIAFNAKIRNNDGLLVGKVADEEGISHFDALKQIEKEREKIVSHLENIGRRTLEGTGELYYDENREIQFNPVEDENWLLDSFGLEPVQLNDDIDDSEKHDEKTTKEEPDPELKKAIAGLLVDVKTENPEILIPEKFSDDNETEEKETEGSENGSVHSLSEEYERKKKRRWLWLLILLIPILAIVIYLIMNDKKEEFVDPFKEMEESIIIDTEEGQREQLTDPVLKDTAVFFKTDSTEQPEIKNEPESKQLGVVPPSDATEKYYLISGSFKEEENALEYFDQLKKEGFEPINLGKNGSFYIIGFGGYDTSNEAIEAKKEYEEKNSKPVYWILKK